MATKNPPSEKSGNGRNQNIAAPRARLIEPLEDRVLFSQPPLTVQPPAAFVVSAPDITSPGGTNIAITVQYTDSTAFNFNTFNENNLTVAIPGGGTLAPTGETLSPDGTNEYPQVTYTFAAPTGSWSDTDDGIYAISTTSNSGNQVTDAGSAAVNPGEIGHFKVFTDGTQAGFSGGTVDGGFATEGMTEQADGAYVLVGNTTIGASPATTGLVVQRYGGSGGNDYTFGADGEDILPFGAGSAGYGVVEQNDGQLDVAGTALNPTTSDTEFTVFRVGGSGFPDPSFGQDLNGDGTPDGLETIDVGGTNAAAYGITLQEDGGIIAVGTTDTQANGNFVVARVNPNTGLLDTGFGTNGYTTTSFGSASAAGAVAILANNDILVAGNSGSNVVLACYTPAGVLDTTFGTNGTETVPGLTTANWQVGLSVQPSGKILVAAADNSGDLAVERLNSDGSLDNSFGTNGLTIVNAGGAAQATSIVVQPGGQIDLGGYRSTEAVVATLSANGAAQNNFSGSDFTTLNSVSGGTNSAAIASIPGGVVIASSTASATQFSKLDTASIAPTATLTPVTITSPTGTATFTVTYNDNVAIDPTTVGSGNVTVSNGSQSFQVTGATPSSQSPGTPLTVTYTIAAPGGEFSSVENGLYTVAVASQVKNTAGVAVAANSDLGTITVDEAAATAPIPSLSAANLTTNNSPTYSFTITYTDSLGINVSTVSPGNVTVTGPSGALTVTSAVVNTDTNGSPRTVTYTVAAPHETFNTADNGTYTIGLANSLQDVSGNPTAANPALGTFTINVTNTPRSPLGSFGIVTGSKKPQKLTVTVNGVPTVFSVTNGSGQAFLNGTNVDLTITASTGKKAAVTIAPKGGRITLGNVVITGNVSTFTAGAADLVGSFYIDGSASTVTLGNLTDATFDAAFTLGTIKAISLTDSNVLDGVQAGTDGTLGTSDDTYGGGTINTVTIAGAINDSVIAAGANPVNGIFGDGNDTLAGAGSTIKTITAKGGTTGATVFESGSFKSASLPKKIKTISADSRFKILT